MGGGAKRFVAGRPVSALVGSLDRYAIEVGQAKGPSVITSAAAKYALEHSELLDPTLPEVRNNAFPLIAEVRLRNRDKTNEVVRIDMCGGLGLLHGGGPVPYVFRYRLPQSINEKKPGIAGLGGPANGSQPTRSETNQTSSAAGSRR